MDPKQNKKVIITALLTAWVERIKGAKNITTLRTSLVKEIGKYLQGSTKPDRVILLYLRTKLAMLERYIENNKNKRAKSLQLGRRLYELGRGTKSECMRIAWQSLK